MPGGAETSDSGVSFRVWAPRASRVDVVFEDGEHLYPDPYSRFQPDGPHGPSLIVDPEAYSWRDASWSGARLHGQVIYELHVGAFTPEGTFDAAARELRALADLGITCIELLPIAEFPGRFNWGYDGVDLFAPFHGYGDPEALKRFVDAAHALRLAVILDVVYNHFGPDGNYLSCFSESYFTQRHETDWGQAIDFDGDSSSPVREMFIANAAYWIREFHLDGLRLDATQSIHDETRPHILSRVVSSAREAAGNRDVIIVAENEPQRVDLFDYGIDALWNDDFHHSARVALTGSHDGYFHDHRGRPQELVSAVKHGFLFQGQHYFWQRQPRGTPALHRAAPSFIAFIQNHDQVANTFYGIRLHELTSAARLRAMTALLLLGPHTPMLFMGQEFNAGSPFSFFADHRGELASAVRRGRGDFMRQFIHYATPAAQARLLDPVAPETFQRSKLDFADRERNAHVLAMHRDLLRLRREDPVLAAQRREDIDGAVLGDAAFVLRWFDADHGDRLLVVNLGGEVELRPAPEPLLAPMRGARWRIRWSSDDPRYGGPGAVVPNARGTWLLPAECATVFASDESQDQPFVRPQHDIAVQQVVFPIQMAREQHAPLQPDLPQ